MHIVQHLFRLSQRALVHVLPDFIVARMTEESDADHNAVFECQAFLHFTELIFKAGATTEGYDFLLTYHNSIPDSHGIS